jgi:hypothetical protein
VRLTRVWLATPAWNDWPGTTESRLVPSEAICFCTVCCAPLPSATMAITAATPMMIPNVVSAARSWVPRKASSATRKTSPHGISDAPPEPWPRHPTSPA